MILSDREIEAALDDRQIIIDPRPGLDSWTSTAVDLTLHESLTRWKDCDNRSTGDPIRLRPKAAVFNINSVLRDEYHIEKIVIGEGGFDLKPRSFVLGYTIERIYLPNKSRIAARVEGKSSLARMGVGVHVTAPTIHAGFGFNVSRPENEQVGLPIQLEIFNLGNQIVVMDKGMSICQLILEEVRETPKKGYRGQFTSQGPS